jgi:hypothetical protein
MHPSQIPIKAYLALGVALEKCRRGGMFYARERVAAARSKNIPRTKFGNRYRLP